MQKRFRRTVNTVIKSYTGHSISMLLKGLLMMGIDACIVYYLFYPWALQHGMPAIPHVDSPVDILLGILTVRYIAYIILPARFKS